MIEHVPFTCPAGRRIIARMVPTLPPPTDQSLRSEPDADVWSSTRPQPRADVERRLEHEEPPLERPSACTPLRLLTVATTLSLLALVLLFPALQESDGLAEEWTRRMSAMIVLGYFVSLFSFAWWTHAQRLTIDALRWRSFRRPTWSWWWTVGWVGTLAGAMALAVGVSFATSNRLWLVGLGLGLVAARLMMLQALGTNMARVVLGAKRWLTIWGIVAGIVDVAIIDIAITGVVETRLDSARLDDLVAWALPLLVITSLFVLSYMKRVERWVLEWWDQRFGLSDPEVLAVLLTIQHGSKGSQEYAGRWLVPTLPVRLAVVAAYLGVAAVALWNGRSVWITREDLSFSTDLDAAIDRIETSAVAFVAALVAVQVAQGLWSMTASWNARRCTIEAPRTLGMLLLFLAGPAMLAFGVFATEDSGARLTLVGIALLVNLVCWAVSFSVLARTLEILGRSSELIARWGVIVSLHWVLVFLFRPLERLESDLTYAAVVVVASIVDALIFIAATVAAWRAMRHFDLATRDYQQLRRVSI